PHLTAPPPLHDALPIFGFLISATIREPTQARPTMMPWRRLLTYAARPSPAAGYASIFSLYFILGAFVALVPLHLQQELGYGPLADRKSTRLNSRHEWIS